MRFKGLLIFLIFLAVSEVSFVWSNEALDLAVLLKDNADYDKSAALCDALTLNSANRFETLFAARIYYLNNQPKKADELLKKSSYKGWIEYLYLGLIAEDLNQTDRALSYYNQSKNLFPNSISLYRLSKICYHNKDYKQASIYLRDLIRIDPSYKIAYYYLGLSFIKLSDFPNAYLNLSKAKNFYPQSQGVIDALQLSKLKLGEEFFRKKEEKVLSDRKKIPFPRYKSLKGMSFVKVGLASGLTEIVFRSGGKFVLESSDKSFSADAGRLYKLYLSGGTIFLSDYKEKKVYAKFSSSLKIFPQADDDTGLQEPFYVIDLSFGDKDFWQKKIDRFYRGSLEVLAAEDSFSLTLVNNLSVEEYLYGVLSAEIPAKSPKEALKAQAVAARTLASRGRGRHKNKGYDFCSDVHCQVYHGLSAETETTVKAVNDTEREILTVDGKPIEVFYHSNCGGCLRTDLWGGDEYSESSFDTLSGKIKNKAPEDFSSFDRENWFLTPHDETYSYNKTASYRWQRAYDQEDFEIIFGYSLNELQSIIPVERGECFHCSKVKVLTKKSETEVSGDLSIRRYFDGLRSSAFTVDLKKADRPFRGQLFFWGAGFGHGLGLSQEGAISMASDGIDYKTILKHYYSKSKIEKY
ncbi:MAG: SpoIID/LytB domain-containing protein [Candidatus Omnitrophica bacterium]|nr:SpoIID/LytB domain-containing protein [Candidatus Omnitrophota bacterium]